MGDVFLKRLQDAQPAHPFLDRHRRLDVERPRSYPLAVGERKRRMKANLFEEGERLGELLFGLARKPDDDVRCQGNLRRNFAEALDDREVLFARVAAAHRRQDTGASRLHGQVHVGTELAETGERLDLVVGELGRVRRRESDALDTIDRGHAGQQVGKRNLVTPPLSAVGVDRLAQKNDFPGSLSRERLDFSHDLLRGPADLPASRKRHDTEGAKLVAAFCNRNVRADLTEGPRRRLGETVRFAAEETGFVHSRPPLDHITYEFGEAGEVIRPEHDVRLGNALEHPGPFLLGHAPPDRQNHPRAPSFVLLHLPRTGSYLVLGLFPDGTRVQNDQVRIFGAFGG